MNKLILSIPIIGMSLIGISAHAALEMCNPSATFGDTTINKTDVDFLNFDTPPESVTADDCFLDGISGSSGSALEGLVNGTTWVTVPDSTYWNTSTQGDDPSFSYAAKQNIEDSTTESNTVLGVTWGLTFSGISTTKPNTGTWTITWEDLGAPDEPVLEATFDIVLGLKGGGEVFAGWLFDELLIPVSPTTGSGRFTFNVANNGSQLADLSNGTLFVRAGAVLPPPPPPPPEGGIPEPGTLALLGLGIVGLGFAGQRRKQNN